MKRFSSRLLIAAIALLLSGLLLGGQVTRAAGPTQPITVGAITLSNIAINGTPGTLLVVAPGTPITVSADWVDNDSGCPNCDDFVLAAFQGAAQPAGCLVNFGRYSDFRTGSGAVNVGTAPTTPGIYSVVAEFTQQFFCGPGWDPNGGTVIAQIVIGPATADQCKHNGWQSFGGAFKNQGDCVSWVVSHGNNPAGKP